MDWNQLEQDSYSLLNMTPHELYEYTHSEYTNMVKGYHARRERELRDYQYQSWHNAVFVGMVFGGKELPSLSEIMDQKEQVHPTSMLTEEEKWNRARSTFIRLQMAGMHVPEETLIKYNIQKG